MTEAPLDRPAEKLPHLCPFSAPAAVTLDGPIHCIPRPELKKQLEYAITHPEEISKLAAVQSQVRPLAASAVPSLTLDSPSLSLCQPRPYGALGPPPSPASPAPPLPRSGKCRR